MEFDSPHFTELSFINNGKFMDSTLPWGCIMEENGEIKWNEDITGEPQYAYRNVRPVCSSSGKLGKAIVRNYIY